MGCGAVTSISTSAPSMCMSGACAARLTAAAPPIRSARYAARAIRSTSGLARRLKGQTKRAAVARRSVCHAVSEPSEAEAETKARRAEGDARCAVIAVGSAVIAVARAVVPPRLVITVAIIARTGPPAAAPLVTDQTDLFHRRGDLAQRRYGERRSRAHAEHRDGACSGQTE